MRSRGGECQERGQRRKKPALAIIRLDGFDVGLICQTYRAHGFADLEQIAANKLRFNGFNANGVTLSKQNPRFSQEARVSQTAVGHMRV